MKYDERELLESTITNLQHWLRDVPFCQLEAASVPHEVEPDWVGRLHTPQGDRLLFVEAKSSGQPRLARDAANQLARWVQKYPDAIGVFAAPYISPAAAEILQREGIGFADLAGNCRLSFDQTYIRRDGWPNRFVQRRDLRSLYSPKAERVLRALLNEPKRAWRIEALARTANVSLGQASNVKRLLDEREWLGRGREGIMLTQPEKLLTDWAGNYESARNTMRDFYSLEPVPQIEAKLASVCTELSLGYALSGFSAAARLAPMVRYQRAMGYVIGDVDQVAARLGLKPVSTGANLTLIEPYDEGVLAGSREVDNNRITSAVQTYLDLLTFRARGQDAAQAILDQVIKRSW